MVTKSSVQLSYDKVQERFSFFACKYCLLVKIVYFLQISNIFEMVQIFSGVLLQKGIYLYKKIICVKNQKVETLTNESDKVIAYIGKVVSVW